MPTLADGMLTGSPWLPVRRIFASRAPVVFGSDAPRAAFPAILLNLKRHVVFRLRAADGPISSARAKLQVCYSFTL
jgi:hypothetical protein